MTHRILCFRPSHDTFFFIYYFLKRMLQSFSAWHTGGTCELDLMCCSAGALLCSSSLTLCDSESQEVVTVSWLTVTFPLGGGGEPEFMSCFLVGDNYRTALHSQTGTKRLSRFKWAAAAADHKRQLLISVHWSIFIPDKHKCHLLNAYTYPISQCLIRLMDCQCFQDCAASE